MPQPFTSLECPECGGVGFFSGNVEETFHSTCLDCGNVWEANKEGEVVDPNPFSEGDDE